MKTRKSSTQYCNSPSPRLLGGWCSPARTSWRTPWWSPWQRRRTWSPDASRATRTRKPTASCCWSPVGPPSRSPIKPNWLSRISKLVLAQTTHTIAGDRKQQLFGECSAPSGGLRNYRGWCNVTHCFRLPADVWRVADLFPASRAIYPFWRSESDRCCVVSYFRRSSLIPGPHTRALALLMKLLGAALCKLYQLATRLNFHRGFSYGKVTFVWHKNC